MFFLLVPSYIFSFQYHICAQGVRVRAIYSTTETNYLPPLDLIQRRIKNGADILKPGSTVASTYRSTVNFQM